MKNYKIIYKRHIFSKPKEILIIMGGYEVAYTHAQYFAYKYPESLGFMGSYSVSVK
ncbi:MAG: hypothetical protein HOG45_07820 [Deltaproteobacteria bacterium]|jgi:hypothetical protein|nr:hypothetical protein [Deltaproteobacteria bacterium]MBT5188087.1 hypothetical protein [Kordiimonadaceae bacterium]